MTAKFAIAAAILSCGLAASRAHADDTAQILAEISDTADRLCGYVAESGHTSSTQVTGQITAELNGLAKKLADLGIRGTGTLSSTEFEGVLQPELREALNDLRGCKLHVFDSLRKLIVDALPSNAIGPIYNNQGIITQG
jgi:hypothetical protein